MTTPLIFFAPGSTPMQSAKLEQRDIAGLDGGIYPRITFSGNRFHITGPDGIERIHDQLFLNVVILDAAPDINKAWWSTNDMEGPPDCWSDDGRVPVGPEATRPDVQTGTAVHKVRSCAECPKQLEGSKGDGSTYKACGTKKRIAVLLPDEIKGPDDMGTVYQMNLGAWSLADKMPVNHPGPRGLRQYKQFLASQTRVVPVGVRLGAVITRVEFEPSQSVPVLRFSVAARSDGVVLWLPVNVQDAVADLIATDEVRRVINPSMTNRNSVPALAAPVSTVAPRIAQTTAQPAVAPAQQITATAPAPAARAKPLAPPPKVVPPAPPMMTDNEKLAKLLDLFEAAYPEQFADLAAWATFETTPVADALAYFVDNTPELVAKLAPPAPPVPKLVAPPTPVAPAKPAARGRKPAPVTIDQAPTAPAAAAPVVPAGSDGAVDDLANMLGALGAEL